MNSRMLADQEKSERALATAKWASPYEIVSKQYKAGDFWIGRSATANESAIGYADDRHVLIVAGSRAGKGASVLIPNLLEWRGSVVVIDPKGENATVTAARRGHGSDHCKGLGQDVYVLDPFNASGVSDDLRASFNPLEALDPDDPETADEAGRLADAMVVETKADDAFWDQQARMFIKAVILHVVSAPDFGNRRDLMTVRELVTAGDLAAHREAKGIPEAESITPFEHLFSAMRLNPEFGGIVSRAGYSFGHMMQSAEKTFASVLANVSNNTDFLDTEKMGRVLRSSTPGFTLSALKKNAKGVSIYLCLPQRYMNTHFRWLRMMTALIVTEMEKTKGRPATGHRVLMLLDEFANLKKMEVMENAAAQIAGFGVKLCFVVQTLTQLKTNYKDNWEVFVANSATKIFFGVEDFFTREYVSKFLGETEVWRTTTTVSSTQGSSFSQSAGRSESNASGTSHSRGTSDSTNRGSSTNSGGSSGTSSNYEIGVIWNTAKSHSTSSGGNWSEGSSFSTNKGKSENWGSSETRTAGTNASETQGRNESQTSGTNSSIHKRALLTPDEVGGLFSRIDDPDNSAFPGLALAIVGGGLPMLVRRTNYFEDTHFRGKFDPHPDHELSAARPVAELETPKPEAARLITPLDHIDPDRLMMQQNGLYLFLGGPADFNGYYAMIIMKHLMETNMRISITKAHEHNDALFYAAFELIRVHNRSAHVMENEQGHLASNELPNARFAMRKVVGSISPEWLTFKQSGRARKPISETLKTWLIWGGLFVLWLIVMRAINKN